MDSLLISVGIYLTTISSMHDIHLLSLVLTKHKICHIVKVKNIENNFV